MRGVKYSVWLVELKISFYNVVQVYQEVRLLQHFIHTGPQRVYNYNIYLKNLLGKLNRPRLKF